MKRYGLPLLAYLVPTFAHGIAETGLDHRVAELRAQREARSRVRSGMAPCARRSRGALRRSRCRQRT